jgi:hypothetical protein
MKRCAGEVYICVQVYEFVSVAEAKVSEDNSRYFCSKWAGRLRPTAPTHKIDREPIMSLPHNMFVRRLNSLVPVGQATHLEQLQQVCLALTRASSNGVALGHLTLAVACRQTRPIY